MQEKEESKTFTLEREFVVVTTNTRHEFTVLDYPARILRKIPGTERSEDGNGTDHETSKKTRLSTGRFMKDH